MTARLTMRLLPLGLTFILGACVAATCPATLPSRQLVIDHQPLTVEIADDEAERACGLSHRDSLAADHGMLFVFHGPVNQAFWMKDTRLPLSIAFLDARGRILDLQDMVPDDGQRLYAPGGAYHYALETNQGWFEAHGIRVGDRVLLDAAMPGLD